MLVQAATWKAVRGIQSVEFDSRALRHSEPSMKFNLSLAVLWVVSGIMSLIGYNHQPIQREFVNQMDRQFYLKKTNRLLTMSVDEYQQIQNEYSKMRQLALDAPTIYLSVKNLMQYRKENLK